MDTSVEDVDSDIELMFKKFLIEEGGNEISVCQNSSMIFLTLLMGDMALIGSKQ